MGLLLLTSCADHPPAVIENKSTLAVEEVPEVREATPRSPDYGPELPRGPHYVVEPGDTLYSVAFRLGMDHRTLAQFNGIDPPFVIRVGQSLTTAPSAAASAVCQNLPVRMRSRLPFRRAQRRPLQIRARADRIRPAVTRFVDRESGATQCAGRSMVLARKGGSEPGFLG